MSYRINPHEVMDYLKELGYENISPQQLKEFITDLKKLIKYDQRAEIRKTSEIENIYPQTHYNKPDVFTNLYENSTTASKAKQVHKKDKLISVQIRKPSSKRCLKLEETPAQSKERLISNEDLLNKESDHEDRLSSDHFLRQKENSEHFLKQKVNSETIERNCSRESTIRPKTSFIRPRNKIKNLKSDPVALYHQYQAEWKKQKIPGENNHSNLRWVIREKMLGEPDGLSCTASHSKFKRKQSTRV